MSKKVLTKPQTGDIMFKLTRESERHRTLKTIQKQQRKGKTVIPNELRSSRETGETNKGLNARV